MSTGNWFRTHSRQLMIHAAIIVGFALVVGFVAEPAFDRLGAIPGESGLHDFSMPGETDNILNNMDRVGVFDGFVELAGWAFIEGQGARDSRTYVVLKSVTSVYVFDTVSRWRPDVAAHFAGMGLDLEFSGFEAIIPIRRVASGEYTIGIYIRKGDIEALQYTLHRVEL